MKRIHVVGGKNNGKTTLVVDLIKEFRARGMRVGTIKHTHHHHELDTPGKDSHRHRESGADFVGILSRSMNAVFWPNESPSPDNETKPRSEEKYEAFAAFYTDCDVVLVEGDSKSSAPKIEVWRAACQPRPISSEISGVCALVTDDAAETSLPVLSRKNIASIADFIVNLLAELKPESDTR